MPALEGRAGSICIWFISCLFFALVIAGGGLLVLYISLPESETTVWFPAAGMILVGIPWVFWITTCIYRSMTLREEIPDNQQPVRIAAVAPVASDTTTSAVGGANMQDSPVNSPGGMRRVRFGSATVMEPQDAAAGADSAAGTSWKEGDPESNPESHVTANGHASSLRSHESEVPLAYSMS